MLFVYIVYYLLTQWHPLVLFHIVLRHSTSKLTWAECMDFLHARSFVADDLGSLKIFLNEGIWLRIEEEKVQHIRFEL